MPVPLVPATLVERSPSREDDIDVVTEDRLRCYGAELIQRAGVLLRVPQVTIVSGALIFHRFYFRKSFAQFDVRNTATAAFLLACKLEETPRKLRDIIVVFWRLKIRDEDAQENGSAAYSGIPTPALEEKGREYIELKSEVSNIERSILRELGFQVGKLLNHPHKFILQYVNSLNRSNALAQRAWGYLNDSLRTSVCCIYEPHQIAAAAIYLAARVSGVRLPSNPPWWEVLDARLDYMRKIAGSIMQLYQRPKAEYMYIPKSKRGSTTPVVATPIMETPAPLRTPVDDDQLPQASGDAAENLQSQLDPSRIAEMLEDHVATPITVADDDQLPAVASSERQSARSGAGEEEERQTSIRENEKGKECNRERERGKGVKRNNSAVSVSSLRVYSSSDSEPSTKRKKERTPAEHGIDEQDI